MFKLLHAGKVWGYNRTYWAAIGGIVGVATYIFIDGAGIEAGTATDALQGLPLLGIG